MSIAVDGRAENFRVGVKSNFRSGLAGLSGSFELRGGDAFFVGLLPDFAFAPDFQIEPVGKRVDDGDADAVQAAGNFVGVAIEFSAGVEHGHDDFGGRLFFSGVHVHGNAAAVVNYGDAVVFVHGNVDLVAESGHGFVHGIVRHFPDQMMQAHFAGGTDVHRGAFADGFDAAKNFNGSRVVLVAASFSGRSIFFSHGSCFSSDCVRMQFANYVLRLREGGRADVPDTRSPKIRRVTLPIGFAHPKLGSKSFEGARTRRRNSKGCGSIPSRSENFGETRRSFLIFPCGKGISGANLASLALARARKTEAISGRIQCRPEGNLNRIIVSKSGRIHKAKALGRIEFIVFRFNGLRGVQRLRATAFRATAQRAKNGRLHADFQVIRALQPGS